MVVIDTLEGIIDQKLWYDYDVGNDVLYLRLNAHRETPAVGEETDDGLTLLKDRRSEQAIGITVVNWWKRFGRGAFPDSISRIQQCIEPLAGRLAA